MNALKGSIEMKEAEFIVGSVDGKYFNNSLGEITNVCPSSEYFDVDTCENADIGLYDENCPDCGARLMVAWMHATNDDTRPLKRGKAIEDLNDIIRKANESIEALKKAKT
jgi:hypothetical protein